MERIGYLEKGFFTRGTELIDHGEPFQIILNGPKADRWRKKITLGVDWPTASHSKFGDPWQLMRMALTRPSFVPVCALLMHAKDCGMLPFWQAEEGSLVVTIRKKGVES